MADLRIDIIADPVCPWCYLGYTRLKQAIDQLGDDYRFQLHWQPFELHPDIGSQGEERERYLAEKFGSVEKVREVSTVLVQLGQAEGVDFHFTEKDRIPNTHLAHQLIAIADQQQLGTALATALFKAYFSEGKDIGNPDVLIEEASQLGLSEEHIEQAFTDQTRRYVDKKLAQFQKLGIQSVPTYVINDTYLVQGAQSAADFAKTLEHIVQDKMPTSH